MPNLGVLYIAAVLEQEGVEVSVVPADVLGLSHEDVEKIIADQKPDVVGITVTTENRFDSFEVAARSQEGLSKGDYCSWRSPLYSYSRRYTQTPELRRCSRTE